MIHTYDVLTMFFSMFFLTISLRFPYDFLMISRSVFVSFLVCLFGAILIMCLDIMSDFPGMFVFFLQIMIYDLCLGDHKKIIRNS